MAIVPNYYETKNMIGPITPSNYASLGFSKAGCPWRGSLVCITVCPWEPAAECDYRCRFRVNNGPMQECPHRAECHCGWDQSGKLELMGLQGLLEKWGME